MTIPRSHDGLLRNINLARWLWVERVENPGLIIVADVPDDIRTGPPIAAVDDALQFVVVMRKVSASSSSNVGLYLSIARNSGSCRDIGVGSGAKNQI